MTAPRSPILEGETVAVPKVIAVDLATVLARGERDLRRDGEVLPPAVAEAVRWFDILRRQDRYTSPPLKPRETPPAPSWWPTVTQAARLLGTSHQNVSKRVQRGTLPARLDDRGRWRVDPVALDGCGTDRGGCGAG